MSRAAPSATSPHLPRRALIVGGSMAGLFTALLLSRQGWQVDVFERVGGELSGRGAGIVTHAPLFDVLARAGVSCRPDDLGVGVAGRRVFDRAGRLEAEIALPQVLTSWGRLYAVLRAHLPAERYHTDANLVAVEEGSDGVTARFEDGTTARGDLLVGADGLHSTVRNLLSPGVRPSYVGYVAWRGLVEEAALSDATRRALCGHFAFSLPPGEQMLGYPVAGADEAVLPGHRRFNFVWYRPAASGEMLGDLLTDDAGTRHEISIPPNRIRPQVIAAMRADADRLLAPQFAEVVRRTAMPFLQAILDLEAPRMRLGTRSVILGDAAFVARPHVGMGVTKAAVDAAALADALAGHPRDIGAALDGFERKRLASGRAVIRRARHLGAYMQAQILDPEERAMAERHRSPEAVMTETAVATGLAA
ncbi:FAD binding domain-containing protein [Roseomonas populi]|uniref:FAD binding domain-containing protein n=1 Tax=Roseomonas populi TaxID=3121582 RepID=A0ABT1XD45_9PROT|nr:FAD binding domain-containing protein [Roseomonas pecuniae]MCR0985037.1 FAD binding domain-containing protein [Roseomonas pecuniae]